MRKTIFTHIAFWLFYTLWQCFNKFDSLPKPDILFSQILFFAAYLVHFYLLVLFILPRYLNKRKYTTLAFLGIASWMVFQLLNIGVTAIFSLRYLDGGIADLFSWKLISIFNNYFVQYTVFALLYNYVVQLLRKQQYLKSENLLKAAQLNKAEKEKLSFEIAALRARINPHLLFNTLAAFKSNIREYDAKTAQAMQDFSDLMRNSIKGDDADGLIDVREELENIKRLINIHQYQFEQALQIVYEETGLIGGRIPSQIYVTLIENGLKHADLYDTTNPLHIRVTATDDNLLIFHLQNKRRTDRVLSGGGVGMNFIQDRLKLTYGNDYKLEVEETPEIYKVTLTVEI
jgi:two-component system, LytTR family, sensor kinase